MGNDDVDTRTRLFLSYAGDDRQRVQEIYEILKGEDFEPFIDKENIMGGADWKKVIADTIRSSKLFLVFLSQASIKKPGHFQVEISLALERQDEMPEGVSFILPVKLDNCEVPDRLRRFQWVELFEENGWEKLVGVVEKFVERKPKKLAPHIRQGLYELFEADKNKSPKYLRDLIENVGTLIEAVSDLKREPTDWAHDRYINFISGLLNSVIDLNVLRLKNLNLGGDWPLIFPRIAAVMADDILAEQMKAMSAGDYYDVISDVVSWRNGQLERFQEQTEKAIKRGVIVRRVFNLIRSSSRMRLTSEEVQKILKSHLDNSRQWKSAKQGKYEVKILDTSNFDENRLPSSVEERKVTESHFGIFENRQQRIAVRFKVPTLDLSEMLLCRDQTIIQKDLSLFNAVWDSASPLTEERIEQL